ncbi:MAG: rod shape-determining protein MreC [Clostridia bacterium]|nr:rod shape-determining protein MreC [Clostridia bacterium]
MRQPQRRWIRLVVMIAVLSALFGALSLVLVEKFMPEQEYLPQSLVSMPSRAVASMMRPLQGMFSWTTAKVIDYLEHVKLQQTIEIEYNKLKAENEELIFKSLRVEELERQIAEWEDMSAKTSAEIRRLNPVRAEVIAKEAGNWFQKFTIDIGKRHGVKLNMAVVNTQGLVGEITKVYNDTAEVTTIIDSRSSIAAAIRSSLDQGVVQGTLGIDDEPTCRMYYLPVDLVPRPNDIVETSGMSVSFPKGLVIGRVRESMRYQDQNKHYVVIEPAVDFRRIGTVMVLIYEADIEQLEEGRDGQPAYSPVPMDTMRPYKDIGERVNDPNLGGIEMPARPSRGPSQLTEDDFLSDDELLDAEAEGRGALGTPNPDLDALLAEEAEDGEDI